MRLFATVAALRCYLSVLKAEAKRNLAASAEITVGLVPTMGALHAGHLSLMQRARQENDIVAVSIFVNPLQFGPTEDYQQYPRQLESDRQLCEQAGVDIIFAPTAEDLGIGERVKGDKGEGGDKGDKGDKGVITTYQLPTTNYQLTQIIPPPEMTSVLCGESRPGHFQGVATIVTKLLNIVQPSRAYFGQKDGQQLAIIRRLVRDLSLPVEIVGCPTVREASGLAMSSRNQYLTPEQRERASYIYRGLQHAQAAFIAGKRDRQTLLTTVEQVLALAKGVAVEYLELVHPDTLRPVNRVEEAGTIAVAARVGTTRLIDNIILRDRQPIVAIDGPAGVGKSTVSRSVARELGLVYLDTGAMYRALTWLVLESGISVTDRCAIAELANRCEIQLAASLDAAQPVRVWINNREVTSAIRSLEVTANVSAIAAIPEVRHVLVKQQQQWGQKGGLVAEGRDIGTQVFPDADLKIFLTASVQERAKRRQQDFLAQGQPQVSLEQLERDIAARDWQDSNREVAPLKKAAGAVEIITDGKSITQVIAEIVSQYDQVFARTDQRG
ncbi:MAG: Bifunctional pantoate ligase/cytidylate kinase [Chroococcidiopsis cubana SAG 39.79]|uniref:bifunctional pantoate--beta-alanine ligase/(d)CMP kinase n=1 Tax=Chroococcidiopsis cubana TaxID=171392 RepID=UPI000D063F5F|nr:bifunctional pantoate--beta-alanine ligase/(d)CMP kinase [Chroococcidiopsis cubana]MDZ4872611.1 Bifunctional pantoate ligase/cytidylate kinase [Chroococcidiopsis cubana SAG 39.79]PSB65484.1 cytidylate kinase [Chroococcidiopsis cubana CCALA 043]